MKQRLVGFAAFVRAITKRRSFGLLAHAEPGFFRGVKLHFEAAVRHAFDMFMRTVAKRLFLAEAASAPGIVLIGYN